MERALASLRGGFAHRNQHVGAIDYGSKENTRTHVVGGDSLVTTVGDFIDTP